MTSQFHVLSLDNSPAFNELLETKLPNRAYFVETLSGLDQMKGILQKRMPDLLFLRTKSDKFDPFSICMKLSKAGIAVIMISSAPTRQLLIKAAKHGAIDVFLNPLKPEDIPVRTEKALIKTGKLDEQTETGLEEQFLLTNKVPAEKVEVLIKRVSELLALPFAVVKVIRLCNDSSTSTQDLEKPVQSDPAIAAMIMKLATSVAYSSVNQASSVRRALVRIGLKATRNLVVSCSVFKLFFKENKSFGFNRVWFWAHSLTTGICAQVLAKHFRHPQPEDAFMAGLLHDIGKMVLDDFLSVDFQNAVRLSNLENMPMRLAEISIFDCHHAYVGSQVAKFWGFPSAIVQGIAQHHRYTHLSKIDNNTSIEALVCMGNHMSKALRAGSGGDYIAERGTLPLWDRLPSGLQWDKIISEVLEEVNDYVDVLEIPPKHFQLDSPDEVIGKVGLFLPYSPNYGPLMQIALERMGIKTQSFSSLDQEIINNGDLDFIIGDLSSVESDDEMGNYYKVLKPLAGKNIVLPRTDEKDRPFNLDFFWFESKVREALRIAGL